MSRGTTIRFPEPLKNEATAYAEALGISLNALVAVALRDYLDQRKQSEMAPENAAKTTTVDASTTEAQESKAEPAPTPQTVKRDVPKVGRNEPCPCGSGRKYKVCCGR